MFGVLLKIKENQKANWTEYSEFTCTREKSVYLFVKCCIFWDIAVKTMLGGVVCKGISSKGVRQAFIILIVMNTAEPFLFFL